VNVGDEAGSAVHFVASMLRAEIAGIKPVGQVRYANNLLHSSCAQKEYSLLI
jgi:hypothetical protein